MNKILTLLITLSATAICLAAPADPTWRTITLRDGTQITASMRGDEDFSYMISHDGHIIELQEDGYVLTSLTPKDIRAQAAEARRKAVPRLSASQEKAPLRALGSPRIPVILANFQDMSFTYGSTQEEIMQNISLFLNGRGDGGHYVNGYNSGAVGEYFRDQSEGQFTPIFEILPPVKLSQSHDYYGYNTSRRTTFRDEAIRLATAAGTDWTQYDLDQNGYVDLVVVMHPASGNETDPGKKNIHSCCYPYSNTVDGVKFACSALMPEYQYGRSEPFMGVFCHELSHALGLPDMYDTHSDYVAPGMDYWDVMDLGEHMNNGGTPVAYTAYEKEFLGWKPLVELQSPQIIEAISTSEGGVGYKIVNDANPDEYYVLEVRNIKGWDSALCKKYGSGLMVNHIDYDASAWEANRVNYDLEHQRVTLIPANGHFELKDKMERDKHTSEMRGHLFPCQEATYWGTLGNNMLGDYTEPAAMIYNGQSKLSGLMHKPVTHIELVDVPGNETVKHVRFHFALHDINADGKLNGEDVAALAKVVNGATAVDTYIENVADTNLDGKINILDIPTLVDILTE